MDWILKYQEDDTPKEYICGCEYADSCLRITRNKSEMKEESDDLLTK